MLSLGDTSFPKKDASNRRLTRWGEERSAFPSEVYSVPSYTGAKVSPDYLDCLLHRKLWNTPKL